jgi:hypothetical protein
MREDRRFSVERADGGTTQQQQHMTCHMWLLFIGAAGQLEPA